MARVKVLDEVARVVCAREASHPIRVGIDGICGAGKTTFATELAERIEARGRPAIHINSDDFHNVREVRYRQGRESARGYYEDAYDFESVRSLVMTPLGPGGSREYAVRVHDLKTNSVRREWATAPGDAVVISGRHSCSVMDSASCGTRSSISIAQPNTRKSAGSCVTPTRLADLRERNERTSRATWLHVRDTWSSRIPGARLQSSLNTTIRDNQG
jgi:ABC-type glutathione transport system ATPase component